MSGKDKIYDQSVEENGGAFEDESEEVMTMSEFIAEQDELQEHADAVLGASDDKNCTYSQGYVSRQALYACRTCIPSTDFNPDTNCLAGVCYACSLECHDGHDLVELYTKRNFCCDCGNSKFDGNPCKLTPDKRPMNTENTYNQNYRGLYCHCNRPYPDPDESTDDDIMLQCIICEDWFHQKHVCKFDVDDATTDTCEELTCDQCMERFNFLWNYAQLCHATYDPKNKTKVSNGDSDLVVDVVTDVIPDTDQHICQSNAGVSTAGSTTNPLVNSSPLVTSSSETNASPIAEDVREQGPSSSGKAESSNGQGTMCQLAELGRGKGSVITMMTGPVFWPVSWRQQLCKCQKCLEMYKEMRLEFLLDPDDSLSAYEKRSKAMASAARETCLQQSLSAFSGLGHVQKLEMLHGINDLKEGLSTFFDRFSDGKKVMRKEDVEEFFDELRRSKRPRTDSPPPGSI